MKQAMKKDLQCHYLHKSKVLKTLIGDKDPIPKKNIGDLILNAFKSKPNFVGQVDVDTGEKLTFQQMRENSVKCALWLKKIGIKKGDVITICTRNLSAVYAPFLASIYIGAIVNPWEEKYFKDIIRVMYFLVINEPDVIFIDHDHFVELLSAIVILKNIKKIIKIVTIGEINTSIYKFNSLENILNDDFDKTKIDKFFCEKNDVMDIAIRTFSSTTVRYPGQVNVPYIAFISPSNRQTPVMFPGDIGLWYESLCWTHGPLLTVHAILSHVTAIKSAVFSEENLFKTIENYKVTWVFLESDTCNQLFQTDVFFSTNVSTLKTLLFDNWEIRHKVHQSLVAFLTNVSIIRVYSKPETGVIAYQRNIDLTYRSVGYVAKNVQLAFIRSKNLENIERRGPNCISSMCCKTPYKPAWYYIGDKGLYKEDNKIIVLFDEREYFIKYKKNTIVPKTIEAILHSHPAVSEVIITGVRHPIDGQHPVAHVKTKSEAKVTKQELIDFVADYVPDKGKLRGGVRFITDEMIPRLPNGKIYRDYFWACKNH